MAAHNSAGLQGGGAFLIVFILKLLPGCSPKVAIACVLSSSYRSIDGVGRRNLKENSKRRTNEKQYIFKKNCALKHPFSYSKI